jgi:transposase InsO family protein
MDQYLRSLYFNPKHPAAYGSVDSVYRASKRDGKTYTRKQIQRWLENQEVHTLHRPLRHKFHRRKIIVSGIDDQWQADLMDVSNLKAYNDGVTFLLTVIDILSKMAWVVPLHKKTGPSIVRAFQGIFKQGRKPRKLNTDQGTEFLNSTFQGYLRKEGIHFFTSKNEPKCAVVERFNRTLRQKMWKHMMAKQTHRYITVLPHLVSGYNHSWHRSIKSRPVDVNPDNENKIWQNLYGQKAETTSVPRYTFQVGDTVRLSKLKRTFEKGYTPNWTREIFRIITRLPTQPPVYKIADLKGEELEGTFYKEELLGVDYDTRNNQFLVESILEERGRGKKKEYLVKWLGYPASFNSWVAVKDMQHL